MQQQVEKSRPARRRERVRSELMARATRIPAGEGVTGYKTLHSLANDLHRDAETVDYDVYSAGFPVFLLHQRGGFTLAIRTEDAQTYSVTPREQKPAPPPVRQFPKAVPGRKPIPIGNAGTCGVCGTTRGNILALHDEQKRLRAYLCGSCYRVGTNYKWEPERMRKMAKVIEAVGLERLQS